MSQLRKENSYQDDFCLKIIRLCGTKMQSEIELLDRSNSFNFCPECPETNESKQVLLIHFVCRHYVKYAEYRKQGLDVLRKEVPGFAGSQLEEILKPILNPQVEESPIVDL
uniref:Uncharacterized protein n=1 Tax=Romanomermis culicivorax TaxID=13658 RepID=A0A915KNM8_ROMCU